MLILIVYSRKGYRGGHWGHGYQEGFFRVYSYAALRAILLCGAADLANDGEGL